MELKDKLESLKVQYSDLQGKYNSNSTGSSNKTNNNSSGAEHNDYINNNNTNTSTTTNNNNDEHIHTIQQYKDKIEKLNNILNKKEFKHQQLASTLRETDEKYHHIIIKLKNLESEYDILENHYINHKKENENERIHSSMKEKQYKEEIIQLKKELQRRSQVEIELQSMMEGFIQVSRVYEMGSCEQVGFIMFIGVNMWVYCIETIFIL